MRSGGASDGGTGDGSISDAADRATDTSDPVTDAFDDHSDAEIDLDDADENTGDDVRRWWGLRPIDIGIALVLLVVGLVCNHDGMPKNGLWYDDSWVASSARTNFRDLLTVSTDHPGFTLGLMVWRRLVPATDHSAIPIYLAGSLAAPALYGMLRAAKVHIAPAALVASLLAMAATLVTYSGRLKPYVFEVLVIIALAALVPRLASRRWRWPVAAIWVVGAVLIATISGFCGVAVAVAGIVLVLNAAGDRVVRAVAVGSQALIQAALVLSVRRTYDSVQLAREWESAYDGYIELDHGPVEIAKQLGSHLRRVGEALSGGPHYVALAVAVVAIAALADAAIRGRHRPMAQFLLGLVAVAFVGGLARQIPFGPISTGELFTGYRGTIWLLPSLAVGLALAFEHVRKALDRRSHTAALVLCGVALVGAVVLIPAKDKDSGPYGELGTSQAASFVLDHKRPDDVVLVLGGTDHQYAAEPGVSFDVKAEPDDVVGFSLVFSGHTRLVDPKQPVTPRRLAPTIGSTRRVYIYDGFSGFFPGVVGQLNRSLPFFGFEKTATHKFHTATVTVWERPRP